MTKHWKPILALVLVGVLVLIGLGRWSQPGASAAFIDVGDSSAAVWAAETGVVSGDGKGRLLPTQAVPREQAAVMLSAVYRRLGGQVSGQSSPFADDSAISSWARSSVYFMARSGIIVGTGNNCFSPQRSAQRQSCLIMALGMYEKLGSTV